jgi:hypothetical protein
VVQFPRPVLAPALAAREDGGRMKRTLLAVVFLVSLGHPALAGRNANGSMVVHTNDNVSYSAGFDFCETEMPPNCESLVTEIDRDPGADAIIWVLAIWCPGSHPGVTGYRFGVVGDIPPHDFTAYGPCGPSFVENADEVWPAPGTGTEVIYGSPVYPTTPMKLYWFAAPGSPGWTFGTAPYPDDDPAAEFLDDSTPPVVDVCTAFGHVAWGAPGWNDCADCGPVPEACCLPDGSCLMIQSSDCAGMGGAPQGSGSACDPNPCAVAAAPTASVLNALAVTSFPTPASGGATIRFDLPLAGHARAVIFDVAGRQVRRLHEGFLGKGRHEVRWDGRDDSGRELGPGLYFASVTFSGQTRASRIALVR